MGWAALVVALVAVDRLALAAEARGWIYWRRRRATTSAGGNALASLQAVLEPAKEHTIAEEAREAGHVELAADDDPLDGARPRR